MGEFERITGHALDLPDDFRAEFEALCAYLQQQKLRPARERRRQLIASINAKFGFNTKRVAAVYALAASAGLTFNYHEKCAIERAFDLSDRALFTATLDEASVPADLRAALAKQFRPIAPEESVAAFAAEVDAPSKLRKEHGERPIGREILLAALAALAFGSADERTLHAYFDPELPEHQYDRSFWVQLRRMHPQLYERHRTLDIARLPPETARASSFAQLREQLFTLVADSYRHLNNHGHLAVWLDPIRQDGVARTWELAADVIFFAEKHDLVALDRAYFRHRQVAQETTNYVDGVDPESAKFDLANEGFTYRDTFVCLPNHAKQGDEALLLLFQKNQRDETLIPCPACRSRNVQGNSYPSLGVRSWECGNLLCPDRSKYNRGKRYSFKALLMQEAIADPRNAIPTESVRSWARDVQPNRTFASAVEMLLRHYSLHGDGVHFWGVREPGDTLGREASHHELPTPVALADAFYSSPWFARYLPAQAVRAEVAGKHEVHRRPGFSLIEGDARWSLRSTPAASFDAAVTSPPYYNARDYATWPNIYCHLHDMFLVAQECCRVLKPGAVYLYNVFDYFDNERSIVFSAMGNKRLPLSAYTVDLFRRAGFLLLGSVTWDKGDIEGKRAFNAGNFSPYYQSPFNCWEHVLVFAKPPRSAVHPRSLAALPAVLRAKPVFKMKNGENVHGHTAPFPEDIPLLLREALPAGARVLDPFGGSCTTARALCPLGFDVTCVERNSDYVHLGLSLFDRLAAIAAQEKRQLRLFGG